MNTANRSLSLMLRVAAFLAVLSVAAVGAARQSRPASTELTGIVVDPSGAVIADATVFLRQDHFEKQVPSGRDGRFRFGNLAAGVYSLEVRKDGFKPTFVTVNTGAKDTVPLRVVLPIAELHEEIRVDDRLNQVNTNPGENLNVTKLDREELKKLPVLGNDVIGGLARLLDDGLVGTAGPTIVIDGLERPGAKIPASQIQEVRINQNPYSAEFSRPGRGRIEVITKPGEPEYHGEFNFVFRDHRFDARNSFATERPPEQRRVFEGTLSGPLGPGEKTSFLFGADREEEDLQAVVFANTPEGLISENVATPARDTELSFRVNHQANKNSILSLRYEFTTDSVENEGVGGFNLPEVGSNEKAREHEVFFSYRRVMSPNLASELTVRIDREAGSILSLRPGVPQIEVLDAFTGGGAQIDERETETQIQVNQIISWNRGKHFIRGGVNIPGLTRREVTDRSNFGGTFSFSTLEDYENNNPFLFTVNEGNPGLTFWRKEFGLFIQDNILMRPDLSIGLGLRYDWQNHLGDHNNLAPRFSFAYAPAKDRRTVLRGGIGLFYDRTGGGPIGDTLRFNGERLRQITITNPGFPDPFASGTADEQPTDIVRFASGIRSPYILQFNLGVERQLGRSLVATASYINARGIKLFRSLDLNAPPPPLHSERPDPAIGVLRQIESAAGSQSHGLELMLRGKIGNFFNGTFQYTYGRVNNNASGINAVPADNYDLTREWSRADFDERHRFNVLGSFEVSDWFELGFVLSLTSGRPYNMTTGRDDNRDGVAGDRPAGVSRNSLRASGSATLDLRWSREFEIKGKKSEGPTITLGVDAFNVLNRTNYSGFVGNLSSAFFGLPTSSAPARRVQFTVGFEF